MMHRNTVHVRVKFSLHFNMESREGREEGHESEPINTFGTDLCINAMEHKVFPGTEAEIFNDAFFQAQDLIVNALDNVEARRYVDR